MEIKGDGSMLEEIGRENGGRGFWTGTRSRTPKERLAEAEALFWIGRVCEEAGSTEYESGQKIVGQKSSPCSEITTCSVGNACMRIPRKKKR